MLMNFKLALAIGVIGVMLSGCGAKHYSVAKPMKNIDNKVIVLIEADQDSTAMGFLASGAVQRTNYKYSFAIAAQTAKDNGYKYFSVTAPQSLIEQFKNRNVGTVQDAYDACIEGEGSFNWQFISIGGLKDLPKDIKKAYSGESYKKINNCENIVSHRTETTYKGTTLHKPIKYVVDMHNEDRKDNVTFNVDEVLNSNIIKGLNKEYFVSMSR